MELLKVVDLENVMSCSCSNRAKSKIDGLFVGPSGMFRQNLRRLRNVLNMLFTFCVDFDGWSVITADSPPPSAHSLDSSLYVIGKLMDSCRIYWKIKKA